MGFSDIQIIVIFSAVGMMVMLVLLIVISARASRKQGKTMYSRNPVDNPRLLRDDEKENYTKEELLQKDELELGYYLMSRDPKHRSSNPYDYLYNWELRREVEWNNSIHDNNYESPWEKDSNNFGGYENPWDLSSHKFGGYESPWDNKDD
ncbi:hypothetical protein [Eubacterium xylanophilum]|uniref:hypothetical protein n=1 Tax=Eubacterium xylanophilum TaxID=39497 RepID=UPI00047BE221|nr:hypothetical protein [Eubacterium xylanophilum]